MIYTDIIEKLEASMKQKTPFVVFRKPADKFVNAFFQKEDQLYFLEDFSQQGFVFAPFDNTKPAIIFPSEKSEILQAEIPKYLSISKQGRFSSKLNLSEKKKEKQRHLELVQNGIDFIRSGNVSKVVLSRKEEIKIKEFSVSKIFQKLIQNYPLAFVSVFYHPKVGLWLGATPEILVNIKDDMFQTMSLAGTQIFNGTTDVQWGEKEKTEQQIVTDFIISKLSDEKLMVSKPFTKKAGNLLHICTEIIGTLKTEESLEKLIKSIHPTPAICGLPKDQAKEFIFKNEKYDREFYSGYLGELNVNYSSDLFVNLRCMKIEDSIATLYIGGGITANSNPENEWEETVAKSEVMKKVILE
ncbi:MAG: chorismate-binding protein [Bacteroidota bacterium]